jgi:hypothetical protein
MPAAGRTRSAPGEATRHSDRSGQNRAVFVLALEEFKNKELN